MRSPPIFRSISCTSFAAALTKWWIAERAEGGPEDGHDRKVKGHRGRRQLDRSHLRVAEEPIDGLREARDANRNFTLVDGGEAENQAVGSDGPLRLARQRRHDNFVARRRGGHRLAPQRQEQAAQHLKPSLRLR